MNRGLIAVLSAAGVVGILGGTWLATLGGRSNDTFATCRSSAIAGGPGSMGGPFELVSSTGETVTDKDVITGPSILYFGFTLCADACPFDAERNAVAVDLLAERGMDVTPVFISFDPARDTPEVVGEFASYMHEDMIGLTGSPEQVEAAAQEFKVFYARNGAADEEYYTFTHSTFSYLMLPDHGFVEYFRRESSPEEVADIVACYVENAPATT